jgi:hypothetical protein
METQTNRRSESIGKLAEALAKAQMELQNPTKNCVNTHFKNRYADLASVRDAVIPTIAKHGLSIVQMPCDMGGQAALTTLLMHSSGEWVETTTLLRSVKNDPQGIGSALTYARRYALQSIAGVAADDDDDGESASTPTQHRSQPQPAKPQSKPATPSHSQRDKLQADLENCKSRAEYEAACNLIVLASRAGTISEEDRLYLRKYAERAAEKFPKPTA